MLETTYHGPDKSKADMAAMLADSPRHVPGDVAVMMPGGRPVGPRRGESLYEAFRRAVDGFGLVDCGPVVRGGSRVPDVVEELEV